MYEHKRNKKVAFNRTEIWSRKIARYFMEILTNWIYCYNLLFYLEDVELGVRRKQGLKTKIKMENEI